MFSSPCFTLSSSSCPPLPIMDTQSKPNSSKSIKPSPLASNFSTISSTSFSVTKILMFLSDSLSSSLVINPSLFLSKVANTLLSSALLLLLLLLLLVVVVLVLVFSFLEENEVSVELFEEILVGMIKE
ncbi:hypothetical protein PanWU01x14_030680 [Parasponia andersonii]|uniref:Transmembrane protein n=1 Tax=Parasponia andersonii TaxID=3476 RepID=A0A2P5DUY4_PARAD|nr:hypothetical protein PanWU01x14_030680 [Parasponia andersonii]